MKQRIVLEKKGSKASVTGFVIFVWARSNADVKRFVATIDIYDNADKTGTVSIDADLPHNMWNCLNARLSSPLIATHCYLKISNMSGITGNPIIHAISTQGSET